MKILKIKESLNNKRPQFEFFDKSLYKSQYHKYIHDVYRLKDGLEFRIGMWMIPSSDETRGLRITKFHLDKINVDYEVIILPKWRDIIDSGTLPINDILVGPNSTIFDVYLTDSKYRL